ncbi:MAG: ABC transporter permease subunit [Lutisporaceae bacterium]
MNVYIQEMKMSVRSMIYWTVGMVATLILFMSMFPALSKEATMMQKVISSFPPELIKALGLSTFDLSSLTGYYAFLLTYILLIASIYAMKSGISVLSEEVRAKTADFLLVKPITRTTIVTAKLISVLTNVLIQNIIYSIAVFIVANLVAEQPYDKNVLMLVNLSILLVQLFFIALGLLLSVVIKKIKTVLPITLGIVFGFFVLFLLYQSLTDSGLAYITPFAYFDASYIIEAESFKSGFVVLDIVLILVFTALSYLIYNKKDMPSV